MGQGSTPATEAKLILEDGAIHDEETHRRILTILSGHGVAEERVDFIPFVAGHERHMALYNRLDIALDTIPFNGGTTTFDALWMGVPMVALEGTWVGGMLGARCSRLSTVQSGLRETRTSTCRLSALWLMTSRGEPGSARANAHA